MLEWMGRHKSLYFAGVLLSATPITAINSGMLANHGYVRAEHVVLSTCYTILFAMIGIGLFLLRERNRTAYAVLEIGVAIVTIAIFSFSEKNYPYLRSGWKASFDDLSAAVLVLGATYILVRGLDNLKQGIEQSQKRANDQRIPNA